MSKKNFQNASHFEYKEFSMKIIFLLVVLFTVSGCGIFSGSALRCGINEDGSYVDFVNVPNDAGVRLDNYAELCGFAFEEKKDET